MNAIDSRVRYFHPLKEVERHRTLLPHWQQPGASYFVTFRLADSLPREKLDAWKAERDAWLAVHPQPWSEDTEAEYHRLFSTRMDEWLDAGHGACVLKEQRLAEVVGGALNHFDGDRCVQHAWVVMPNHVHALFTLASGQSLEALLHSWKSFTANAMHRLSGDSGPVWQRDYFDRLIRDEQHFRRCVRYIRRNPEKAQLRSGEFLSYEAGWVTKAVSPRSDGFQPSQQPDG